MKLIQSIILIFILSVSTAYGNEWRRINTQLEETGLTEVMHFGFYAGASGILRSKGVERKYAILIPWTVGFAKELTDKNFGGTDLAANTAGCLVGVYLSEKWFVTPNSITYTVEF